MARDRLHDCLIFAVVETVARHLSCRGDNRHLCCRGDGSSPSGVAGALRHLCCRGDNLGGAGSSPIDVAGVIAKPLLSLSCTA